MEILAALSYLGFLEEECAAYVTMTNIDSPVWNPVRERLLEALARHLDRKSTFFCQHHIVTILEGGEFV